MSITKNIHSFLWMLIPFVAVLSGIFGGGFYFIQKYIHQEVELQNKIKELKAHVTELTAQNERLQLANRLLKVDTRRARIDVLSQTEHPDPKMVVTKVRFQEFGPDGKEIGVSREFTLSGDMMYLDGRVAKFNDQFVETSDNIRGHSLFAFRGIFGKYQTPEEAFPIDVSTSIPVVYQAENGRISEMEKQLWSRFWEISNDPLLQETLGLRANHGEAISQQLVPGKSYLVELRASGGLSIRPINTESEP
ncbi:MAG: hypothetical protein Q4C96_06765 [Planctomycetia bacterium]|nr:hypothetical protein [Planctomycetia bacterium]